MKTPHMACITGVEESGHVANIYNEWASTSLPPPSPVVTLTGNMPHYVCSSMLNMTPFEESC